jgi:NAD/NADP transhydrogenase alpha subunit
MRRLSIGVESGAGTSAFFLDAAYQEAGASVESDPAALVRSADIVLKIHPPTAEPGRNEVQWMRPGTIVLASVMPLRNLDVVPALAAPR